MTDALLAIISRMTIRRKAEIEFAIVELLALSHAEGKQVSLSRHEIGRALQSDPMLSDWLRPSMVDDAIANMLEACRIVSVDREGRTLPAYALPEDPMLPIEGIAKREEKRRKAREGIELRLIASLRWPRFFHIPSEEDLLPYSRMRTGCDVQADMDRF